ncbi:MAG: isocitrate/isopropylmalate dehydrogenase family protein [Bacteroidales bacterium]|nr:isocitrate/isopropylmalate dehydrogenase family protein [Bacteroidales bacterium]
MYNITLIPGDGIGVEVTQSARKVIDASGIKINWEIQEAGSKVIDKSGTPLPQSVIDSIRKNKIALKGPVTTPVGKGFRSVNVALRKELELYASVRPVKTLKGVSSRFDNVDIVVVRENIEDLYMGIERYVGNDTAESIKRFTKKGCERIIRFAFEYARNNKRKKVTAVHKANIMKLTDGMFLDFARKIAEEYKEIIFEEMIVDVMCMNLVLKPEQYDVLVLPNLYGDIVSDLCAGLIGGLGIAAGANFGENASIFEPAHGSAPDIAGQNKANPTAAILSGVLMLKYIGEAEAANKIENAVKKVLMGQKVRTADLGGNSTTTEFTDEIIKYL